MACVTRGLQLIKNDSVFWEEGGGRGDASILWLSIHPQKLLELVSQSRTAKSLCPIGQVGANFKSFFCCRWIERSLLAKIMPAFSAQPRFFLLFSLICFSVSTTLHFQCLFFLLYSLFSVSLFLQHYLFNVYSFFYIISFLFLCFYNFTFSMFMYSFFYILSFLFLCFCNVTLSPQFTFSICLFVLVN
jgi:hypothetical protein